MRRDGGRRDGRRALLAGAGALAGLAAHDVLQRRHALLRNFPVIGHARYALEGIGPELRQYVVAGNDEERPFSRDQRRWVYSSSKGEPNTFAFGTDNEMDAVTGLTVFKLTARMAATGAGPDFITIDGGHQRVDVVHAGVDEPRLRRDLRVGERGERPVELARARPPAPRTPPSERGLRPAFEPGGGSSSSSSCRSWASIPRWRPGADAPDRAPWPGMHPDRGRAVGVGAGCVGAVGLRRPVCPRSRDPAWREAGLGKAGPASSRGVTPRVVRSRGAAC